MYKIILKKITNKIFYNPYLFRKRLLHQIEIASQDIATHSAYHHKIHFECSAAHLFLGYTYQFLLDYEKASENFQQALFQDPFNKDAITAAKSPYKSPNANNLGLTYLNKIFYDHKDTKETANHSKKYVYGLAITSFLNHDYKNALELLNKIFFYDKTDLFAHLLTGIIYLYKHNYPLAKKYLEHSMTLMNKQHTLYHYAASRKFLKRAEIYYALKELDLSCDDLTKSIDLNQQNIDSLLLRANIYIRKKEFVNALKDLEAAKNCGHIKAQKIIDKIHLQTLA